MGQKERDEELARITKDTDEPTFVIPVTTHPVPAEIVSDARDTWMKRVPIIALILILMYFTIGGQVQSAQNGSDLTRSLNAQSQLLKTVQRDESYVILASQYIQALRHAHKIQNRRLRKHGLQPVPLPKPPKPPPVSKQAQRIAEGRSPSPQPSPSRTRHSHPSPKPTHSPSPSPSPTHTPILCTDKDTPIVGKRCTPIGARFVIFVFFR
jgi:hypothetical protein